MTEGFGAGHSRPGTHRATMVVHLHSSWVTPGPTGPMPAGSTVPELQPGRVEGFSAPRASRGDVGGPHMSRWVTGPPAEQENRRPLGLATVARQFGQDGRRTTPGGTVTSVPIATQSRKAEPVSSGSRWCNSDCFGGLVALPAVGRAAPEWRSQTYRTGANSGSASRNWWTRASSPTEKSDHSWSSPFGPVERVIISVWSLVR